MTLLVLLILALASYRFTRLITTDTITNGLRKWLALHATTLFKNANKGEWREVDKEKFFLWRWLYALTSCDWCVSVWTGAATIAGWKYQWGWFEYVCYGASLSTLAGWGTRLG
jgi:hypothetical protein